MNDVIATMVGPHDFEFLEHMICFKTSERNFRIAILISEPDSSVIVKCIRKTLNDVIAAMVGPHDFEFLEHMICFKTSERNFRIAILI